MMVTHNSASQKPTQDGYEELYIFVMVFVRSVTLWMWNILLVMRSQQWSTLNFALVISEDDKG